jgi:hypothetical protein
LISLLFFTNCAIFRKPTPFIDKFTNIDYSNINNWAALPGIKDSSDLVPTPLQNSYEPLNIDVFYIYPTTLTKKSAPWNADINDSKINLKTDKSAIKYQASIFNLVGQVYAPRYRQANLKAYFSKDKESSKQALDLAYQDVKASFVYYLNNYNKNRPFIIVSHSQGTTHAVRLIKELVDNKVLQKNLIAAYLIGLPILKSSFKNIKPCDSPNETGCFCSWRTFKEGYEPKANKLNDQVAIINPISWTTGLGYIDKAQHKGSILQKFNFLKNQSQSAQIYKGVVWTNKPKFKGSFLIRSKNYHPGDLNFFYLDIQQNARLRTIHFLDNKSKD